MSIDQIKDSQIQAAFRRYRTERTPSGRVDDDNRDKIKTQIESIWNNLWRVCDFTWSGLADAGWDRGESANEAQKLKRWRAPIGFPGNGEIVEDEHGRSYRAESLQSYWRWSLGYGSTRGDEILSDEELLKGKWLVDQSSVRWHVLFRPSGGLGRSMTTRLEQLIRDRIEYSSDASNKSGDTRLQCTGFQRQGMQKIWDVARERRSRDIKINANMTSNRATECREMLIAGDSDFSNSLFDDKTDFFKTEFDGRVSFLDSSFFSEAVFTQSKFKQRASFANSVFIDGLNGNSSNFLAEVDFGGSGFFGQSVFMRASFTGTANFSLTRWIAPVFFQNAVFHGNTSFDHAVLNGTTDFLLVDFRQFCSFYSARFGSQATFAQTKFQGGFTASDAVFMGKANFRGCQWNRDEHYGGAFDGARFERLVNFKTAEFSAFAAFQDAVFKEKLLIGPPENTNPNSIYERAERAASLAIERDIGQVEQQENESKASYKKRLKMQSAKAESKTWSQLAGGYRAAKLAMRDQGDFEREQTFYRCEVRARMRQPENSTWMRMVAQVYSYTSEYGGSVFRPILMLLVSVAVFCSVYCGIFIAAQAQLPKISEIPTLLADALTMSWNAAFRGLFMLPLAEPQAPSTIADQLFFCSGVLIGLFIRMLVTIQAICSIILVFLSALAIRRKFQIG